MGVEGSEINHDCHKYSLQCDGVCNYDVSSVFVDIGTSGDPAFVVSDVTQRRVERCCTKWLKYKETRRINK